MEERVVITGVGIVSPVGIGKEAFWQALKEGKSGIARITAFDPTEYSCQIAGEVKGFNPLNYMEKREARRMGRATQFGVAAAKMALEDAGLTNWRNNGQRLGLILGYTQFVLDKFEEHFGYFKEKGSPRLIDPHTLSMIRVHTPASTIAQLLKIEALSSTLANDCSAGLMSIGEGFRLIKSRQLDIALCGGISSVITPFIFGLLCAAGTLTKQNNNPEKASRPFDRKRDGVVYSEGGALVILERLEDALLRKARIYGEVLAIEEANRTGIRQGAGWADTIRQTLEKARVLPTEIDYISAHAPSHPVLDESETLGIKQALGAQAYNIPVSAIKSMIGNPGLASGPSQLIASLMSLQEGIIPPTINYEYPDPECDLDYVPNYYRINKVDRVLILSGGMGGCEACAVIKKL
jgi:3-oxoacyl-[acyl-carrier-protein] synthase II